ncbi:MAG: aminodeoxychorismate synthase component I [Saprospiraceae bacterium]|nr:aminodeoxychorismate synthase component I [Saprospiraceae bacterium]
MPPFQSYRQTIQAIAQYQKEDRPFLFVVNFAKTKGFCEPIDLLDEKLVRFNINQNRQFSSPASHKIQLNPAPIHYDCFKEMFHSLQLEIQSGNTYLTNLTCSTDIQTEFSLLEIYEMANAKYKLWIRDHFVVFSPECFVRIEDGKISTFPMKGTILADRPDAATILLEDPKEDAEHYTIIDLLRNDLHIVAKNVIVSKFKYLETIKTNQGELIQMSSQIEGELRDEYIQNFGSLLDQLLPAGSVTGAPKKKTIEIIQQIERHDRGFYTGIFGIGTKTKLESAVMIRFIEQNNGKLVFKSGGGITHDADPEKEYQEMLNKVYVPIF